MAYQLTTDDIRTAFGSNPSRSDRAAIRIINGALTMGLLAPFTPNPLATEPPSSRLYPHEVELVANAVGASVAKTRYRISMATYRLTGICRTAMADAAARAYMNASEDLAPEGDDPSDMHPFQHITVQDDLHIIADKCENLMMAASDRLRILDLTHACRRIVRDLVRLTGARTSVPVRFGHSGKTVTFGHAIVVGTAAVDNATRALQDAFTNDARHRAPIERFWRISKTVLEALGATVNVDLDVMFSADNPG